MSSKTGGWLILLGVFVALGGLIILPAAARNGADRNLLGAGMSVFSMGVLLIAIGIYFKAKDVPSSGKPAKPLAEAEKRGGCERCHAKPPAVQCKVHQIHLCDSCLSDHYDFRSCVYVPSTRRPAPKANKTMVAKAR